MGGVFDSPDPPPAPAPPPEPEDSEDDAREARLEAIARRRRGREDTIETGHAGAAPRFGLGGNPEPTAAQAVGFGGKTNLGD